MHFLPGAYGAASSSCLLALLSTVPDPYYICTCYSGVCDIQLFCSLTITQYSWWYCSW